MMRAASGRATTGGRAVLDAPREAERLGLLGLARRAGWAAVGTRAVREAGRAGRLAAVVLAGDAAENARLRLGGLLGRGDVPLLEVADRARLGAAVGKGPVAVVGVMDAGIARRLLATDRAPGVAGADGGLRTDGQMVREDGS